VLASIAAVVVVQVLAIALLSPPSRFAPLGRNLAQIQSLRRSNEPIIFTALLVSGAVLVFAVIDGLHVDVCGRLGSLHDDTDETFGVESRIGRRCT
jgi:hypothetical protein